MSVINADSTTFNKEINSTIPVIVDFWAPWCAPCKALSPILEDLATKYDGTVKVLKVNVSENQDLAAKYSINSIPFIGIFINNKLVKTKVGFSGREDLEEIFEKLY